MANCHVDMSTSSPPLDPNQPQADRTYVRSAPCTPRAWRVLIGTNGVRRSEKPGNRRDRGCQRPTPPAVLRMAHSREWCKVVPTAKRDDEDRARRDHHDTESLLRTKSPRTG